MTYMHYMQYINSNCVSKTASSLELQFTNTPLLLLVPHSAWVSESLLEQINQVVNNVKMSFRKPTPVLLRALSICKKKKNSLLRITVEEPCLMSSLHPEDITTEKSLLF